MLAVEIKAYADKLYDAIGPKALAQAAQRAKHFELRGEKDEAATWRRIEKALQETHGPRAK